MTRIGPAGAQRGATQATLVARTRCWHARLLQCRDKAGHRDEARRLAASSPEIAHRLGMADLDRRVSDLVATLA